MSFHSSHIEQYPTNKQYTAAVLTPFQQRGASPNIIVSLTCSRRSDGTEKEASFYRLTKTFNGARDLSLHLSYIFLKQREGVPIVWRMR